MIGSALSVRRPPEVLVAPQTAPHPPPPSSPGEGRRDDSRGDAVLAARLRCGDETALAEVYDLYGPTALAAARRATGDPHAAEEAVQEALLWVWTHADRFDPERGTLRAWLALLTHRRAVDWVRAESARRRRLPDGAEEPVASAEDSAIEAEDGALAERIAQKLRTGVEALPAAQRDVVRMLYFEGRRVSDIAVALGLPEGTAKTRLRAARQRLAAYLAAEGLGRHGLLAEGLVNQP